MGTHLASLPRCNQTSKWVHVQVKVARRQQLIPQTNQQNRKQRTPHLPQKQLPQQRSLQQLTLPQQTPVLRPEARSDDVTRCRLGLCICVKTLPSTGVSVIMTSGISGTTMFCLDSWSTTVSTFNFQPLRTLWTLLYDVISFKFNVLCK